MLGNLEDTDDFRKLVGQKMREEKVERKRNRCGQNLGAVTQMNKNTWNFFDGKMEYLIGHYV